MSHPPTPLDYSQRQQVRVFVALAYAGAGGLSLAELRGVVNGAGTSVSKNTVSRVCGAMVRAGYITEQVRTELPRRPVYYVAPGEAWQVKGCGWERAFAGWCERWEAKGE